MHHFTALVVVCYSLNFCSVIVAALGFESSSLEMLLVSSSLSYPELVDASEHVGFNRNILS